MLNEKVFSLEAQDWKDVKGLPGARGYEFKTLVAGDPQYTSAYSCELVRLDPSDHSVPHQEPWSHALYFLQGSGEITIGERTWPVAPQTVAKVRAGEVHALRNLGGTPMLILATYDPPRQRVAGEGN